VPRLVDVIGRTPRSRDYQESADELFDAKVKAVVKHDFRLLVPPQIQSYLTRYVDGDISSTIMEDPSFMIESAAQRLAHHIYDEHGLGDLLVSLHCTINPIMLLLYSIHDPPMAKAWSSIMRMMPSRGGEEQVDVYIDGEVHHLREVNEADRMNYAFGDLCPLDDIPGTSAVVDPVSRCVSYEYIVMGTPSEDVIGVKGKPHLVYRHTDKPGTKTASPHYRLYDPDAHVIVRGVLIRVPIIFANVVSGVCDGSNIIEHLPYPEDVTRLMEHRPKLAKLCVSLLYAVLYGEKLDPACDLWFYQSIARYASMPLTAVFRNGSYRRTKFSDLNHGYGPVWNRLYQRMFQ